MRGQADLKNEFAWFIKTKRNKMLATKINNKKVKDAHEQGRNKIFRGYSSVNWGEKWNLNFRVVRKIK